MIMDLRNLENKEIGIHFIIAGSGGSVKQYRDAILAHRESTHAKVIGINYMSLLCCPDYHLWTNQQRYRDLGRCVDPWSTMLFGCNMPDKIIKKHYAGDYFVIDYESDKKNDFSYRRGVVYGHFRTAGTLAIMIAHIMGASNIDIVGMDGYTLYGKKEIKAGDKSHHCYGQGYTDDANWEKCKKKDQKVYKTLRAFADVGVEFRIITPTKFKDFYDGSVLGIDND